VKTLLKKQEEGDTATTRYNLCESVYGKAEVDTSSGIVNLWLGANVMLEYTYEEAIDFLSSSLETHRGDFQSVQDDLAFVRDQIVTCEVCMTRTYNWSVRKRRTLSKQ
jgi:prefoldin subunit 5